ncbi:MAG: hypothetical protein OXJ54_03040 [Gemmatimonadetes bacterium]|nr:hypothetical protein [Candidatus Palauibacter rhopaloidicola]
MASGRMGRTATVIVAVAGASCGPSVTVETTVADSAGVAIVTNVGAPRVLQWTLDTIRIFGGEESGPATFHLAKPSLMDVDAQGRIFVLEPFEYRVTVFDSTGVALGSMGRQGEGPGELEWAMSVSVLDDGRVYVHDGAGQIVELRMGDETGTESAFNYAVIYTNLRHVEATSRGLLIWARRRINPTGPNIGHDDWVERLLSVTGRDTVELISGKSSYSSTAYYPRCSFTFSIRQLLAPRNRWSQWGDHVALTAWGGFRIDMLDDHRLVRSVRWAGVGERELTCAEAKALLTARGYLGPCDDDLDETLEKHGFHPRPQLVGELAVAPDGYVWAQLLTRNNAFRVLLLNPEGRIAGVMPDGFPMPLTFLPDGRPLIAVVDSLDVERIGVGSVVR